MLYLSRLFNILQPASWGIAAAGLYSYQRKHTSRETEQQNFKERQIFSSSYFQLHSQFMMTEPFSQPCDPTTTKGSVRELRQDLVFPEP